MTRHTPHHTEPLAYTINEAIRLSGLSRTTIYKLIEDGALIAIRPRGLRRTLIDGPSLRALLRGETPPVPPNPPAKDKRGGDQPFRPV